jgi:hypothetical protein
MRAADYSDEKLPPLTRLPFEPVVSATAGIVKNVP